MSVRFRSSIEWPKNELMFPVTLYGVHVPPGLSTFHARAPNFVDVAGMSRLLRSGTNVRVGSNGSFGMVGGLVTSELKFRFENARRQWRCVPAGGASSRQGPGKFDFTGGDVFLDLALGVFVLDTMQPNPNDDIAIEIFSEVYSHELLHVLDYLDILKNWIMPRVTSEPTIARYLVRAETYTFGRSSDSIAEVERGFHTYIQNTLQTEVQNLWTGEANRRQALRDSPAEYRKVQDRINNLRIRQVNR